MNEAITMRTLRSVRNFVLKHEKKKNNDKKLEDFIFGQKLYLYLSIGLRSEILVTNEICEKCRNNEYHHHMVEWKYNVREPNTMKNVPK